MNKGFSRITLKLGSLRNHFHKASSSLVMIAAILSYSGCTGFGPHIVGSGHPITKEHELSGFSKVDIGSAFDVEITQNPKFSVSVSVDDNLVEYLDVSQSGDTLRIHLKPAISLSSATLKAKVGMPELTGLDLSGAVRCNITGFNSTKRFDVELSGASSLRGDIKNGDARIDLSGAAKANIHGSSANLHVTASGASNAALEEYTSNDTWANASGASHITVTPSGELEAEASGASSVRYGGEPKGVKTDASGASSVRRK